jgi:hypothetical protein
MSAHSRKFHGETARVARAEHHTGCTGIGHDADMFRSQSIAVFSRERSGRVRLASREATHTDPQILFPVAAS